MSTTQPVPTSPVEEQPTASTSAVPDSASPAAPVYPPSAVALLLAENPTLSRSAAKKLLREKAWEEGKAARKAATKAKDKAKLAKKRELAQIEKEHAEAEGGEPASKKVKHAPGQGRKKAFNARVVIDLGFDELMTDKEVKSMASQLSYCYSANRKTNEPLPLLFTSFNGRLRERYESVGDQQHKMWKGVEWWEEDYTRLWKGKQGEDAKKEAAEDGAPSEANGAPSEAAPVANATASTSTVADPILYGLSTGKPRSTSDQSKVVYLTGDSPNVLTELEEGTTYILGGIVDRNRYKNLCYNKAIEHGIAHAQLPIGEFLPEMTTRKVLTVNQVFEIMARWVKERHEGGPGAWKKALEEVMPKRKYDEHHKQNKKAAKIGEDGEEEEDEEDVDETVAEDGVAAKNGEPAVEPATVAAGEATA